MSERSHVSISKFDSTAHSLENSLSRTFQSHRSRMTRSSLKVRCHPHCWFSRLTCSPMLLLFISAQLRFVLSPCLISTASLIPLSHTIGVCGTDGHIHDGEFISTFPVRDRLGFYLATIEAFYSHGHIFPSNSSYPVTKPLALLLNSGRM